MKRKILVVDNDPVILKLMTNFLENQGHEVLTAKDGLEALDVLITFIPDIMFIDLVMPNISGERLCRIIGSKPEYKSIFLVILSATAVEEKIDIEKIGAHACIAKGPFKFTVKHIASILDQLQLQGLRELSKSVLGSDEVFQRQVTKELLAAKRHNEAIFNNMAEGVIEFTKEAKIIYVNQAALTLTGISEEQLLSTNFIEIFSSDQREKVQSLLDNINTKVPPTNEDSQLILKGRHVELRVFPIQDGEYESLAAIVQDVNDRIQAEKALKENELYLKNLVGTMQAGLIVIDPDTHTIVDANPSAAELFGAPREKIVGKVCHKFICPKGEGQCPITDLGQEIDHSERRILNIKGEEIPVLKNVSTAMLGGNEYLIETFIDITERKLMEAKLREASITDDLTGLLNRRGFFSMAEKIFHNAERRSCELFLLYLDIDNFKSINDHFGHSVGDQAIEETASVLQHTYRQADVIGRVGGDEFVVLYTDKIGADNQQFLIDRLAGNLKRMNERDNRDYKISLSYGVIKYDHEKPCSLDELISRADKMMYECKAAQKGIS